MRTAAASLLLMVAPLGVWGSSLSIDRANIANPGIYALKIERSVGDASLAGRSRYVVTGIRKIRSTTSIPARICTSFGFEYVIVGAPPNVEVPIKMVTKFPSGGLTNPQTQETTYRHETVVNRTVGKTHFRSYTLESLWELVPGVWTFELWYQNRKLGEQSFTLSVPCASCDESEPPRSSCDEALVSMVPHHFLRGGVPASGRHQHYSSG